MNLSSLPISHDEWKNQIINSNIRMHSLLENAIEYMAHAYFIYCLGVDDFVEHWSNICGYCPQRIFRDRDRYDVSWNILANAKDVIVLPLPAWKTLTEKEKTALLEICSNSTKNTR